MDLKEAIESLDPKVDDNWTEAGLPSLEVLKKLTGKHVSRKEATEAAPMLTRERLLTGENTQVDTDPDADKSDEPDVKVADEPTPEPTPEVDLAADLKAQIDAVNAELSKAEAAMVAAEQEYKRLQSKSDALQTQLDRITPAHNPTHDIMAYLESQKRQREARGGQAKDEMSQLDKTLMTRRRPARTPL